MDIRLADKSDQQVWDEYVLSHPAGTAYHQFAWGQAVEKAYHFSVYYLMAIQDGRIAGVLPLVNFRIPFWSRDLISLPYCDVGGGLANDCDTESALAEAAIRHAEALGCKRIHFRRAMNRPLGEAAPDELPPKVRMLLPLPDRSETLLSGFKSKLRSQINKPIRDGLSSKIGGIELVDQFYTIFARNMRDLGSPVHSLQWIKAVVSAYDERVRVGVVYTPKGLPAAAGIILLHSGTISIPWASSLRTFNHLNSNVLLYWRFLEFAADNGYNCFDFGRSTPGEGSYKFKAQWGARPEILNWIQFGLDGEEIKETYLSDVGRDRIASCWQCLPLFMSNFMGPLLRRFISL